MLEDMIKVGAPKKALEDYNKKEQEYYERKSQAFGQNNNTGNNKVSGGMVPQGLKEEGGNLQVGSKGINVTKPSVVKSNIFPAPSYGFINPK